MVRSRRGRQKIEMKKISKESNLQVSFSKRRYGLFKKASELVTLCGAKIFMIVFSPGGKVFSFGHPNVKDLTYRFSHRYHNPLFFHQENSLQLIGTQPDEHIQRLNKELIKVQAEQENETNKRKYVKSLREARENQGNWWGKDVKELNINQTNHLICALQDLRKTLASKMSQYSENYFGESSRMNITSGSIDDGLGLFNQRRMLDVNAFNCNPNMIVPEHRPSYEYCNNRGFVPVLPEYNMNYPSRINFNQT